MIALSGLGLSGCPDDDGGPSADTGSVDESGGVDDGATSGGEDGLCNVPGATVIAPPAHYAEGSVIYRLVVDGDTVFFATIDEIYSVPVAGGEPSLVYPPEPEAYIHLPFWILGDELVVLRGDTLEVLPKTGGAVSEIRMLPVIPTVSLGGPPDMELDADGNTFYGKRDVIELLDEMPSITYFSYDFEADAAQILLEETDIGDDKKMIKAGDFIYTAHRLATTDDPMDDTPDGLYRFDATGGPPEPVAIEGDLRFDILAADETHLYLGGRPAGGDILMDAGGVYRLPFAGGTPEKVIDQNAIGLGLSSDMVVLPDAIFMWFLDNFYEIPRGSGEATSLFTTNCQTHALAATPTDLFVSTFIDDGEMSQVLRLPVGG